MQTNLSQPSPDGADACTVLAPVSTEALIDGVIAPAAPTPTKDFVAQAVKDFIGRHGLWPDTPAEEAAEAIAAEWRNGLDGYRLARALDDFQGWDGITADDVETLDSIDSVVSRALSDARKAWAEAYNIQPPHPIGSRVSVRGNGGVIVAIYEYEAATYSVKEDGCTNPSRTLLVKFEDAKLEGGAA